MSRRQNADLGRNGTEILRAATIEADAVGDDPLAHRVLGQRADGLLDGLLLALVVGSGTAERLDGLGRGGVGRAVAILLVGDLDGLGDVAGDDTLDGCIDLGAVVNDRLELERLDRTVGGDHAGHELTLQVDRLLDPHLAGLEAVGEDRLVDLGGAVFVVVEALLGAAGFDHHHGDVAVVELAPGDDDLERARFDLFVGRVRDPLAVLAERHPDDAERALEGDARQHERRRCGVDRQHVVLVALIGAEHGRDDLGLVAETLGERRAQGPVGEPAGEDRFLGGTTFPTEERAGDLAGRVGPLLDIDRQREEVHARTHALGSVGRGQHLRAADGRHDGALALRRELAGLEGERLVGS